MTVALLMIAYHLMAIWFPIFNPILHQNIHPEPAHTLDLEGTIQFKILLKYSFSKNLT